MRLGRGSSPPYSHGCHLQTGVPQPRWGWAASWGFQIFPTLHMLTPGYGLSRLPFARVAPRPEQKEETHSLQQCGSGASALLVSRDFCLFFSGPGAGWGHTHPLCSTCLASRRLIPVRGTAVLSSGLREKQPGRRTCSQELGLRNSQPQLRTRLPPSCLGNLVLKVLNISKPSVLNWKVEGDKSMR